MDDHKRQQLGDRIRERRKELGLLQGELAELVGKKSPAYIALIESGERNISTMGLMELAKALKTTVADLIGEPLRQLNEVKFTQALRNSGDLDDEDRKKIEEFYNFLLSSKKNNDK